MASMGGKPFLGLESQIAEEGHESLMTSRLGNILQFSEGKSCGEEGSQL